MSSLTPSSSFTDVMIAGVIVETTGMKTSSNGKDYVVWQLNDMMVSFNLYNF